MISDFLAAVGSDLEQDLAQKRRVLIAHRFRFMGTWEEFLRLFVISANCVLREKCEAREFVVDEHNEHVIKQLYLYMSHSKEFKGDLCKGIMLQGAIGSGKSLLLRSYEYLQNRLISKGGLYGVSVVTFISSTKMLATLKKEGVERWSKRELMIDELGREQKVVYEFGNQIRPMVDLLCARAENRAFTHATTNFTLDSLASDAQYGGMVGDRLVAMFNFITVGGLSRRS